MQAALILESYVYVYYYTVIWLQVCEQVIIWSCLSDKDNQTNNYLKSCKK
jgi:hypothetical protein